MVMSLLILPYLSHYISSSKSIGIKVVKFTFFPPVDRNRGTLYTPPPTPISYFPSLRVSITSITVLYISSTKNKVSTRHIDKVCSRAFFKKKWQRSPMIPLLRFLVTYNQPSYQHNTTQNRFCTSTVFHWTTGHIQSMNSYPKYFDTINVGGSFNH